MFTLKELDSIKSEEQLFSGAKQGLATNPLDGNGNDRTSDKPRILKSPTLPSDWEVSVVVACLLGIRAHHQYGL